MKKIVLISCVKKKRDLQPGQLIAAKDLYISSLFQKAWSYANTLGADKIYILSAKHHLLDPNERIAPYNETLNSCSSAYRRSWAEKVISQMKAEGLNLKEDHFIILAGKNYYTNLIGKGKLENYELPYNGCKGIGYILNFLTDKLNENE